MYTSYKQIYSTEDFHTYITYDEIPELIEELRSEINNMGWLGKLFGQDKVKERKIAALKDAGKALSECHSLPVIQAMLQQICQDEDVRYSWFGKSRSFKLFDWSLKLVNSAISWREAEMSKGEKQLKGMGISGEAVDKYRYMLFAQGEDKVKKKAINSLDRHASELAQPDVELPRFRRS